MPRTTFAETEPASVQQDLLAKPIDPTDLAGSSAFRLFARSPRQTEVDLRERTMEAPSGRSEALAALRAERHELLQKRRLGAVSQWDLVLLAEVERAMERIQQPEVDAMARRDDALFERLEAELKALMAK